MTACPHTFRRWPRTGGGVIDRIGAGAERYSTNYGKYTRENEWAETGLRYPTTIRKAAGERGLHPTQKPVRLLEYLLNTYTQPGAVILDCCMGSGSTGVAAANTGRNFIGIERDPDIFARACERINLTVFPAPR